VVGVLLFEHVGLRDVTALRFDSKLI